MTEPLLRIRKLQKRYGQAIALDRIHLDVHAGEFLCFLGPSGCGKTTLLRAIAGLDPQTAGSIHQGEAEISALPAEKRGFGIVFQSYALFPNLTVLDNVAYGLVGKLPRAEREARARELLATVGLEGFERKYPAQCSGGQQQRVALARALAPKPGLLLLDEPLSALDARVRVHLRSQIKALQAQLGVTTIMVTHDQEEALTMADRIVVMNRGEIEQVGTPYEIYEQPRTRFVADFVGAMNFLPARLRNASLLEVAGTLIELPQPASLLPGLPITAGIRPERVRLAACGLPATLLAREFLGSQLRLLARLADGSELQLLLPVEAATGLPEVGGALALDFNPDYLRLFPAEPLSESAAA